jgi:hypothetical protein
MLVLVLPPALPAVVSVIHLELPRPDFGPSMDWRTPSDPDPGAIDPPPRMS